MTTPENWVRAGFGLYVHWPFCAAKCPYCDFNSHVVSHVDADRWQRAYLSALERTATTLGVRSLSSIFFGGGTPSLMPPSVVAAIIDRATGLWPGQGELEITLEANPTSVEAARFAGYRAAGVNRVSIGVQSLNDDALRRLGRMHTTSEAVRAVEVAQQVFPRASFDIIYARQGQSVEDWRPELELVLALAGEHLSLYQLTIEPGTAFARRAAVGRLHGLPDETQAVELFEVTQALCTAAGRPAYETSNHSVPGGACRHNLIYWRGGDWVGVGPGAHGRHTIGGVRYATEAIRAPDAWLSAVEDGSGADTTIRVQRRSEVAEEYILTSLRLMEGTDLVRLATLGTHIPAPTIARLVADGLLRQDGSRVRTTAAGRLLADGIAASLALDAVRQEFA